MSIEGLTRFFTESFRSPRGRVVLLSAYYLVIIIALILMYGKGELTATDFIYQGF